MWEEKTSLKFPWAFAGISCSLSTRWWVYAPNNNLRRLSTWQGLASPQRQTSIWAQPAYFVSQAGILISSISWPHVLWELHGHFRSESQWRRRGHLRRGSCSRVTGSHADTFLWPGINATATVNTTDRRTYASSRSRRGTRKTLVRTQDGSSVLISDG